MRSLVTAPTSAEPSRKGGLPQPPPLLHAAKPKAKGSSARSSADTPTVKYYDSSDKYSVLLSPDITHTVTTGLALASSPFVLSAWADALKRYPDRGSVDAILKTIIHGADLGYDGPRVARLYCRNLPSARWNQASISADLSAEVAARRMAGPFPRPPLSNLICSPLGSVPKRDSDKRRRIHHLSWPTGASVNDRISNITYHYSRFDDAMAMVRRLGRGCYLCKIDVKAAFRCVPVRPEDWHLLGMYWQGQYYVDLCLPFGLRSSPATWERFSRAIEWILKNDGPEVVAEVMHYVDDYLAGAASRQACQRDFDTILARFRHLGVPVAVDKLVPPSTTVPFLGITLDTVAMEARLSQDRLDEMKTVLRAFIDRKSCNKKDLQRLVGKLSFAARVAQPGRVFISSALEQLRETSDEQAPISDSLRLDLQWWLQFLEKWNGVSLIPNETWAHAHTLRVWTDASRQGYGAVCGADWISIPWTDQLRALAKRESEESMPFYELYAIASSAATWGDRWRGRKIMFACDSNTVVLAAQLRRTASPLLAYLFRCLYLSAATYDFAVRVVHIPGISNNVADALSRLQIERFRRLYPHGARSPTTPRPLPIPHC